MKDLPADLSESDDAAQMSDIPEEGDTPQGKNPDNAVNVKPTFK